MQVHLQERLRILRTGAIRRCGVGHGGEAPTMQQRDNGEQVVGAPGVRWRKSRHSNPSGSCVEVADLGSGSVGVRHSRFPGGPALVCTPAGIAALLAGVKDGEFDDLSRRDHGGQQTVTDAGPHPGMLADTPRGCDTGLMKRLPRGE